MKNIKKLAIGFVSMLILTSCGTPHTHVYDGYEKDDSQHWQVCECGEETEHVDHEYSEEITTQPTCEDAGVKTFTCVCGDSFTREIDALGHDWDDGVVTTEPGATTVGTRTYTCTVCGETREEEINPTCLVSLDTESVFDGYSTIYRIDILEETDTFETTIDVYTVTLKVKLAVKVSDGGVGVYYHPVLGGSEFQWITNEENTGGWANVYDYWYEKEGELTDDGKLTVKFETYEGVKFPAGAKIYIAVETINYELTTSDVEYLEGYTVHSIKVLKETGTFSVALPLGEAEADVLAAVEVVSGTTWIGFTGGNITATKFFRPEWNTGDWWEPFNKWNEFVGESDANGNFIVNIEKYDADLTVGTEILVATKVAAKVRHTVTKSTTVTVPGYEDVWEIEVVETTNTFSDVIPAGVAGEIVYGKITVVSPSTTVYVEPQIGGLTGVFWHDGENWWEAFGAWRTFVTTLDGEGNLPFTIKDYLGEVFPVGTKITVALSGDHGEGVITTIDESVKLNGYGTTHRMDIVRDGVLTFERTIKVGEPDTEILGKLTVLSPNQDVYYEPFVNGTSLNFFKGGDGWSRDFGVYTGFNTTTDANGCITVQIKDYNGAAFNKDSSILFAVKEKPTEAFSVYEIDSTEDGYETAYYIEVNFPTNTFSTKITAGSANAPISGKIKITSPDSGVYFEPYVNGTSLNFFKGGDGWSHPFGEWKEFTATADANGQLDIQIKDFGGTQFPAESQITIVLHEIVADPFEIKETTEVTYQSGYTVYAIEVTEDNGGDFTAKVQTPIAAGTKVGAAITCGGECNDFVQVYANGFDDWKFWHNSIVYGGNWSFGYGEWFAFETTVGENGIVEVSSKNYGGATVVAGTIIYIALQTA